MNPEIKQQWTAALRSGEYKQAVAALRNENAFCCLGVLCDLHSKATGTAWRDNEYGGREDVLPNLVAEWAGLLDANPIPPGETLSLAELNDRGDTFAQIADLIEGGL